MSKNYLPIASSISILCLIASTTPALAQTSLPDANSLEQVLPTKTVDNQITSVSQLSDVQPTDWAFQALRSLIERYGVITGYPGGSYRGNRAMTRYEFAAVLNTTLERVNQLIANGITEQVSREDLATLRRLQQEYATELTRLRVRLDILEARAAQLEVNQFSPTTKLTGQTIFAVNGGGFSSDRLVDPTGREIADNNPNTSVLYRAALDFNASFFGTDLLKVRLDTGSNGGLDNAAGVLEPNFGSVLDFSVKPPRDEELGIGRLYYTFTPLADFQVSLGPAIVPTDYIDRNSYANLSFLDFSTQALVNNYILFPINDLSSGAAINWNPSNGSFTLRAIYVAADAANPSDRGALRGVSPFTRLLYPGGGGNRGIFGDPYQGTIELEYSPSKTFALRLQYSGGNVFDRRFDVFGANVELTVSPRLGIFGRYGYGSYDDTVFGDIEPNYWMAGMAFRNLFVPGAVAGIAAGQPFIEAAVGNATQTNYEAFYNFPISDNLAIAPLVQVITNPANQDENGTIVTGTLRTVFSF
jgi:porin